MDKFCYKIYQFCLEHSLLEPGDRVVVGVSGGRDSVCLALFLDEVKTYMGLDVEWAHFNHQVRETADRDEKFVAALAESTGNRLKVYKGSFDKSASGFQALSREWRRNEMFAQAGGGKISMGHHLDDLVETFFWKLGRGSSLLGLNSMKPINDRVVRPLLHTSRDEITSYLIAREKTWVEDETNASTDYTRNKIRLGAAAFFKEEFGENYQQKILGVIKDIDLVEDAFLGACPEIKDSPELPYESFTGLPRLFACETIARWAAQNGCEGIDRARVEKIYEKSKKGEGGWLIEGKAGCSISGLSKKLVIKFNSRI